MTAHPYEDLEALALGGLDEQTSRRVLAHADNCPTCAAVLAQAMHTVNELEPQTTLALASRALRATDVPLRSSTAERAAKRWRGVAMVAAAAALVLAAWSVNAVRNAHSNVAGPVVPIAALVHSHFLHHALRGTGGSAKVIQALDGSWIYLVGDGFAPNRKYTLEEMTGDVGGEVGQGTTNTSGQISGYWTQTRRHIDSFRLVVSGSNPLFQGSTLQWP
ncbi:MAG: zf-HC2 domain-containing protein [Candidatus Eremiobacteraeota bacterium]|nr:zf-HC2 domain-containing protein [Candidatus Eremiobacteraeota bacterium]